MHLEYPSNAAGIAARRNWFWLPMGRSCAVPRLNGRHGWVSSLAIAVGVGIVTSCCGMAQSCCCPPDDLVAWWPGNGSGVDLASRIPATLRGGASYASGKVGYAFDLDGISGYVSIPNTDELNPESLTIDAWILPTIVSVYRPIVSKYSYSANQRSYLLVIVDGHLWFTVYSSATVTVSKQSVGVLVRTRGAMLPARSMARRRR